MSQKPPRGSTDAAHAADADPGAPRRAADVVAVATARAVARHIATRAAEAMAREVVARVLRDTLEPAVRTQVDRGVRTVARAARHTAERVTAEAHEGFRREIDHIVSQVQGTQQGHPEVAKSADAAAQDLPAARSEDILQAARQIAEQAAARTAEDVAEAAGARAALLAVHRLRNAVLGLAVLVAALATFIVLDHLEALRSFSG